jgi:hypothetical protein
VCITLIIMVVGAVPRETIPAPADQPHPAGGFG